MKVLSLATVLALWAATAHAADITVETSKNGTATVITINGDIHRGDSEKFRHLAQSKGASLVRLISTGGATLDGLEIGAVVHELGMSTFVEQFRVCESACALIWLGGHRRFIGFDAQVGFHQTYNIVNGQKVASLDGMAYVADYARSLGLSEMAVAFINSAAPDEISHLDRQASEVIGMAAAFDVTPAEMEIIDFERIYAVKSPVPMPRAKPLFVFAR